MLTNINKSLERVFTAFRGMGTMPRIVVKYGCVLFLIMLVSGLGLLLLNSTVFSYSSYLDLIAKSIVKTSFQVEAEIIIGALILDFAFKK
jgi:hypothetical protein